MAIQEKIIGIDLGTTNSVVSIMEGGEVKVIANQDGNRLTPSVVAFTEKGDRLVGDPAKRQAVTNPKNTIYSIKRFMGRRHSEVESEEKIVPYKVVGGASEYVKVEVHGKTYTPPEISAMVLRKLKEAAEAYLGHTVTRAVVTVPAYFNDAQRQATKDAGEIAGLKVDRIINEPTAAALAYGLQTKKNEKIAVFDFGGGTFDISVLEVEDDVIEVLSTNGDTHLGGDDFDQRLVQFVSEKFEKENGIDLRKDAMALQRLREAAEKAKKELSTQQSTDINLPFITADSSGAKHLQLTISRAEFEKLIDDLVERCRIPVESALRDAKLKPEQIDEVVLVGGSTRVPKIQEFVKKLFKGKEPHRGVNPDEVVSIGAAIQGAIITGDVKDMVLFDVTPLSLGIETEGGIMTVLVERNTTIPVTKKETFSTAADGQTAVTVSVYQGERPMARDNRQLSQFNLDGIPPAPRGVPKVEVSFDIDVNGILSVKAKDTGSGKEQTVKVENASGIDTAEVDRMKRDAEAHAAEDKRRRELAEAKNKASTSVYDVEKMLKEHGSKLDAGSKSAIEAAIAKVKEVEKGEDPGAINAAVEALQQASYAMAQHMQGAAGATPGADGQPDAAGGKDDGVIDAEFEKKS